MSKNSKIQIICFAWDNWSPFWKMTQQLMFYVSRKEEVEKLIYVNQDLYLMNPPPLFGRNVKEKEKRDYWIRSLLQRNDQPDTKILVHTPFHYFPFSYRNDLIKWIDRNVILYRISRLYGNKRNIKKVLFINRKVDPYFLDSFKDVALRCFYWSDDWSSFPAGKKRINEITSEEKRKSEEHIEQILKRSQVVFAVSEELQKRAKRIVESSFWLPNGTDYNNFERASLRETEVALEIRKLEKPIIGLVGFISSSLDFNLLRYTASSRPNWSFVIIGPKLPAAAWGEEFFKMQNVYYLGPKPYFELPNYMKAFDVCIIPYIKDDSLRMADSNKIYDYLATGKPIVVSQNTAGIDRFKDLIRISKDQRDFVLQIEECLKENDQKLVVKRQEMAKENSWEKRADFLWNKMREFLF